MKINCSESLVYLRRRFTSGGGGGIVVKGASFLPISPVFLAPSASPPIRSSRVLSKALASPLLLAPLLMGSYRMFKSLTVPVWSSRCWSCHPRCQTCRRSGRLQNPELRSEASTAEAGCVVHLHHVLVPGYIFYCVQIISQFCSAVT